MSFDLNRFINAQEVWYEKALLEIKLGKKVSHWMWFIFPQISGLGYSEKSKYYSINNLSEAQAFLEHPLLGTRLIQISKELLTLQENDISKIFAYPDNLKLKSSMTLFLLVSDTNDNIFLQVLNKYFNSQIDIKTLMLTI